MAENNFDLSENDLLFEEELLTHEFEYKAWRKYIDYKRANKLSSQYSVNMVYERALRCIPYSYKLWNEYIRMRRTRVLMKMISDDEYTECNDIYERCLEHMNKMPRVYIEFVKFLMLQRKFAYAAKVLDRSLAELPVTQHYRIWPLYVFLVKQTKSELLTKNVFQRYLKIYPEKLHDCLDFLCENNFYEYTISLLLSVLNYEQKNLALHQKNRYNLVLTLVGCMSKYASISTCSMHHIALILRVIDSFTDGLGQLYCYLADYYVRIGQNEAARDVLVNALTNKIRTVKDFGIVFDTLVAMDEIIITRLMQNNDSSQLEYRLARLEYLIEQRPIYLSDVLLRQNPYNVDEWLKRVDIFVGLGKLNLAVDTFTECIGCFEGLVNNNKKNKFVDNVYFVFEKYVAFCEENFTFEQCKKNWLNVLQFEHFCNADYLAELYCGYVEFILTKNLNDSSLNEMLGMLQQILHGYKKHRHVSYHDFKVPAKHRLFKNLKLWCLLIDLTDMYSKKNDQQTKIKLMKQEADHVIDLQIANPQFILNYARFLIEQRCFEEAFKVYESGISLFQFPHAYGIYSTYLVHFLRRYKNDKMHRVRMLLDQAIHQVKSTKNLNEQHLKNFYVLYAQLEEKYGLHSRMDKLYMQCINSMSKGEQKAMYIKYINSAIKIRGFVGAREIFDRAIQLLPVGDALILGGQYVKMEQSLNEINRCRSIFHYLSQIADPRVAKQFWEDYARFEMEHGDKETYREMLRIKRSVTAHYNVEVDIEKVREYKKALQQEKEES